MARLDTKHTRLYIKHTRVDVGFVMMAEWGQPPMACQSDLLGGRHICESRDCAQGALYSILFT